MSSMPDFELTPPLFAILSSLIEERAGLCYTLQDREILASKISSRATERGFGTLLDYYYFLRYDPESEPELTALINALVVNETFFFREFTPLSVLVTELVAPRVRSGQRARIWCAACSTGEEPLTLAMLLEQHGLLDDVELIASDISSAALAKARAGEYGRRSLRQVAAPELAAKWLTVRESGVTIAPQLRAAVSWRQINLMDHAAIATIGAVDFIVCRNVLIYFRDSTAASVVNALAGQLPTGGVLLVGISESLMRYGTLLSCEEVAGVFLYRRGRA
jgi:chemotaxis protein methyltransferase CheR